MRKTALTALGVYLLATVLFAGGKLPTPRLKKSVDQFVGRWDVTVTLPNSEYPDWLEVTNQDGVPAARLQQRSGSVHPVESARVQDGHLFIQVSPTTAKGPVISWDLHRDGKRLKGAFKRGDMVNGEVNAVRAPELKKREPKAWKDPEPLFNGKDLAGWEPDVPGKANWVAKDGAILNESGGANLKTLRKFQDFKLHVEFNCPNEANSGIYLRGRYEVQVEYEKPGVEDKFHEMGSIYGMLAPSQELPRKPGEWETFDITLVGRYVTIARNGVVTIDHQAIPGITGGAIDAREGEPGPFYLQGDHTGGMQYKNITVSVPKN